MDIDDDDDFYAPDEPATTQSPAQHEPASTNPPAAQHDEDLEEGEEEDEGAEMDEDEDSDVDIITERKDGTKAPPPTTARYSDIRNIPQRTASSDAITRPAIKKEESAKPSAGAELPAVSTSKVDVNAIPIHKGTGKPITQVNIDEDLPDNNKPWRKPGTDLSDYFNYGFDEFTWALYAAKQDTVRGEYSQDAIAQNNKKMMEDMQMMMMGGMPPSMPGMDGMTPEMQQMMQQMMASGMDPSQMDPSTMAAMMSGNAAGGQGGQNQNFGGPGQGFGNNQGQGFNNYDQGMGRGGGGGGFGGRGRRGRGGW
ncbi:Fip1 motif-domain-containing protein [Pseudomassariella vexata]|uniref:Fip1 motif-domain-containing protein n=1 Tax=Pseudomassariella vexata TaxID=1141098 RepID=A0A1Y2DKH2_9PEZI|nr:Fip1 motif-domain-containing protein [Pseudomassariella vexata]ORY59679.1 Fip1 motif-domain-containing protein [Pseudomassariella vexata]